MHRIEIEPISYLQHLARLLIELLIERARRPALWSRAVGSWPSA